MATNNPFGKFRAESDSEEEVRQAAKPIASLDQAEVSKKKKKVRPEKQQPEQPKEDNEGFEEVGKKQPRKKKEHVAPKPSENNEEEKQSLPKKDFREGGHIRGKPGNPRGRGRGREFERRSGTGRGREIAKGGAGGKHTWGTNPKANARQYENSNDDYLIDRALHPEKRERKRFNKANDEQQYDKKEDNEHKEEEGEHNENQEVNENEGEVKERKERKEKTENKPEVKEEEKLKLPTNAISLEEYLANKQSATTEVKTVEKPKDTQNLKVPGAGGSRRNDCPKPIGFGIPAINMQLRSVISGSS